MINSRIKTATSVVLAALLLASTVAPPAIRHVHAVVEGDTVHHRHDSGHGPSERHGHGGGVDSHHRVESERTPPSLAGGQLWHLHVELLGFDFTLPDLPSDERDGKPGCQVECVMPWSAKAPITLRSTASSDTYQVVPQLMSAALRDAAPLQVVVSPTSPILSAPLCDRARHERSGVLLA